VKTLCKQRTHKDMVASLLQRYIVSLNVMVASLLQRYIVSLNVMAVMTVLDGVEFIALFTLL
jgi:hypothetical protein